MAKTKRTKITKKTQRLHGGRPQVQRRKKPAEETSKHGGFGAVAPETLNVAHVPYSGSKPEPAPRSKPVFSNGVWWGKLRKIRKKK